jgi:hypothetical protein
MVPSNIEEMKIYNPGEPLSSSITHEGMLHISTFRWDNLTNLDLGEDYLIQTITVSEIKGANTSLRPICPKYNRFICVRSE